MDDFLFVEIPPHLKKIVGEPDPGTRIFRAYGNEEDFDKWFDAVWEICGDDKAVSPGGVSMFAKVTRAGVHKRMKEGRLTAFLFHKVKESKWIKGRKVLEEGGRPYGFIPVSECKAWAKELSLIRDAKSYAKEANGDNDFEGRFLDKPKGWRKKTKQE